MDSGRTTELLQSLSAEDPAARAAAAAELMPLVYDELHRAAVRYFRGERVEHTLQPTALVNEAYLRLVGHTQIDWRGRSHFVAMAARIMRQVLVDHARGKRRIRRGGGRKPAAIEQDALPDAHDVNDLIELSDALEALAQLDPRQARVVELRFFAGMTMDEVAAELSIAKRTAEDDWTHAKAWLRAHFANEEPT